jgi:hypothetical protein
VIWQYATVRNNMLQHGTSVLALAGNGTVTDATSSLQADGSWYSGTFRSLSLVNPGLILPLNLSPP